MEEARIKTIIVIESLPANERKTGTELYNDIIVRSTEFYKKQNDLKNQFYSVESKAAFLDILTNIDSVEPGLMLHIETHGSEDKTGLTLADSSKVLWS